MAYASEDIIKYWIVILDSNESPVTDLNELKSFADVFYTYLNQFTENYIWQQDPFYLDVCSSYSGEDVIGDLVPHLHGSTNVGEYIEDEWFITFLLVKLSEQFKNIVIRVSDSDGEYILAEAADHLPKWAEYKNAAQQRVFLQGGSVHLVTPTHFTRSGTPEVLPVMEGIHTVARKPSSTLASPHIQEAIQLRIQKYPSAIRKEQHIAHAFVPVGVAALLREYPTLVAPAVTSFCSRDSMDSKALRVMRHFPPEQRVMTAVRFSKALYAKLMAFSYVPDRKTGWNLPPPSDEQYRQHCLGVKLACGFELLVCNAGGLSPSATSPSDETKNVSEDASVSSNPRWGRYKQALSEKGYFRGELEGSKLYKELEANALNYFSQNLLHGNNEGSKKSMDPLSAGAMIIKLLGSVNKDLPFFTERQKRLVPADNDSWLNVSPDMLDEMLENHYGSKEFKNSATSDENIQSGLEAFLKTTSDFEGVEVSDELQEKLRKLSTMSLPRKKESTASGRKPSTANRKKSQARKVSSVSQCRKISSQSTTSNASQMSSLSNKIDLDADAFSDAYMHCMEKYFDDDDYFESSDDESGLSNYGNEEDLSPDGCYGAERKVSNGSTASKASSGIEPDMKCIMREMENQLRQTTVGEHISNNNNEDTSEDGNEFSSDDEFDDVEDFKPVKVDAKAVEQLVKTYKEEKGGIGPATTLLTSLGMKPK